MRDQPSVEKTASLADSNISYPPHSKSRDPFSESNKREDDTVQVQYTVQPEPVSFKQLFQYSTPSELTTNAIGIVSAMAAGAAQPLMSLIFGRLTELFVSFTAALNAYQQAVQDGNATEISSTQQNLDSVAASFRSDAALDATYLVCIGVVSFVCTLIYMYTWTYTGEASAKRIREKYLQAILRQDVAFFDIVGAGEVTTHIQTGTHHIQQGISEKVPIIVSGICSFITGFALAYSKSWRLALAMSCILPIIAITGKLLSKFVSKYRQANSKYIAESGRLAEEVISTVRTAQAFGSQNILASRFDELVGQVLFVQSKEALWHGCSMGSFFFVIYGAYALAFDFGTTLINEGHATSGDVVNVLMAILVGSFALALLPPDIEAISAACGSAANIFAIIKNKPRIDSASPKGLKPVNVVGQITLEDVVFNYPARSDVPILKRLSLTFEAGKTVALVGASGSGKSTIISLIERFYDPQRGLVKLDGIKLPHLNVRWLRSQIGLVSQEPVLFATTIKENVVYGLIGTAWEHASEEKKFMLVKDACIKSNADGFISKLPQGYDTMVGERGFLLSGGQKQRVAIARAIVSDPRILLLDEATSALDTQSEGIVQDALDKASTGRTTITIAHRLSTIKDADKIYVMGDGVLLEQGTHYELLAQAGPYAHLVHAQKLREEIDADTMVAVTPEEIEEAAAKEAPARRNTVQSVASSLARHRSEERKSAEEDEDAMGLFYLFCRFGRLSRGLLHRYALIAVAALTTGMVYPVISIVYGHAIGGFAQIDPSARRHDGDRNALWFFLIAIVYATSVGSQSYISSTTATKVVTNLRSLSFRSMLRQDIQFFDREENNTGALTQEVNDNPSKVYGLAGTTLAAIIQAAATLIGGSVIGLVYAWKVALVAIACIPVLVSTGYIRLQVVILKDQKNKQVYKDSAGLACEVVGAIRTVASLTREEDCLRQYSKSLDVPLSRMKSEAFWSNLLYAFSQASSFFVIALVFWYGARLVSTLELSTITFFISLMAVTFGAMQTGQVFAHVPDISSARSAGASILKLLDSTPEIDAECTEGKTFSGKSVRGKIQLQNVHFRYPTRRSVPVLRGLDLEIMPGTYVALVGASGCGKSTVIQLLERFYDPLRGHILLDDQPISEYNVQEYRKQIALVSQEPTLYAGTVRFNVLLGATKPISEVTQQEIEAACRNANILDFIQGLPDGFETEVGGKGSRLSGGQKQRIAIARALIRNPKVLLLDEATSALDSESESVVQAALDRAAAGRTTIAIAHRLSTIQNANRIYFIKEGRVSEAGTHDELLTLKGDYYEYVQLQALKN